MQSDVLSLHLRLGVGTIRHFFDNREGNWRRNVSRYCFWDLYWGRVGQLLVIFFLSPVIVPEVFAKVATWTIVSFISDVFERRTSTGSGVFALFGRDFEQILGHMVSLRIKTLSNTNLVASKHIKREKGSLLVDVCCSNTSLP